MELEIRYHEPVTSKDGQALGVAQTLYHSTDYAERFETQPYERHLKLFDFETGDDLYIPVAYLSRDEEGRLIVDLTNHTIEDRTFSRKPRYIAYDVHEEIPLLAATGSAE